MLNELEINYEEQDDIRRSGEIEDAVYMCENCSENNNAEYDFWNCPLRKAGLCSCEED